MIHRESGKPGRPFVHKSTSYVMRTMVNVRNEYRCFMCKTDKQRWINVNIDKLGNSCRSNTKISLQNRLTKLKLRDGCPIANVTFNVKWDLLRDGCRSNESKEFLHNRISTLSSIRLRDGARLKKERLKLAAPWRHAIGRRLDSSLYWSDLVNSADCHPMATLATVCISSLVTPVWCNT